jgi:hypothetical protein
MYYFSHGQRKPKKRDCLVVRLLTADTHDAYLGGCVDHAGEAVSRYGIIKAAAMSVMRPMREVVQKRNRCPVNARFNQLFAETGLDFAALFADEASFVRPADMPHGLRKHAKHMGDTSIESILPDHRPHRRVRINRFRLNEGEALPPTPPHHRIIVRRHKHHHVRPLRYIELPPAEELIATGDDRQHVWSPQELSNLFLLLSRYPWGQWARLVGMMGGHVSPAQLRDCAHAILRFAIQDRCDSFPILARIVQEYSRPLSPVTFHELPSFGASQHQSLLLSRLRRIESLAITALLVSCSTDPMRDIPIFDGCALSPAMRWTETDDRRLLWSVWQGGLSSLVLDFDELGVAPDAVFGRFDALISAARGSTLRVTSLPQYSLPSPPAGLPPAPVREALRQLGLLSAREISALARVPLSGVRGEIERALLDFVTLDWVDFFERVRADLRLCRNRPAEDRQFLAALAVYGTAVAPRTDSLGDRRRLRERAEKLLAQQMDPVEARLDANGGRTPVLPADLGPHLRLIRLGTVDPRFADTDYIYPVGFASRVMFWSLKEPGVEAEFESVIADGGGAPVFRVTAVGDSESVFEGKTPDAVWRTVAEIASRTQGRTLFDAVRPTGFDLFGLASPLALRFVQALPGAEKCTAYCPRTFHLPFFALQKEGRLS